MVKSSGKFKKLLSFSKKKATSTDDTAQISPPIVDRAEALTLPQDIVYAFPYVQPTTGGSDGNTDLLSPMLTNEWTENHSTSLRSRLEKVLSMGKVTVEREEVRRKGRAVDSRGGAFGKVMAAERPGLSRSPSELATSSQISPFPPSTTSHFTSHVSFLSDARFIDNCPTSTPPSPTLSTKSSVHFVTSLALRDNKPGDGLSSLGLLNAEQSTRKHRRNQSWASYGEDHSGVNQFGSGSARRRSSILLSPSPTLSRQSSVHFVTGTAIRKRTSAEAFSRRNSSGWMSTSPTLSRQSSVHFVTGAAIRKRTSAEAFSRRNSSGWMSTSPTRSVQSSVRFSTSTELHSNSARDDDL